MQEAHHERLAQQLERQVKLNYELARRCAAHGAQISMLTQMGEKFLNGTVDQAALHTELVARYIDGAGFSCGAILLAEGGRRLSLSAKIGFSDQIAKSLPELFATNALLRDAMLRGESLCLTTASNMDDPANQLLAAINAETAIISPLRFASEELGAIVLASQVQVPNFEWLGFSKAVTNQIAQIIALNNAITQLQYLASYDPLTQLPNRSRSRGNCPWPPRHAVEKNRRLIRTAGI